MAPQCGYAISPVDGTPLFYERDGQRTEGATPTLLTDGIGCDGFIWKYLRRDLAGGTIHWHYPGHGRSPAPHDDAHYTIPALADDAACVLDELDVPSAVLMGHSMGVQVVLETYRRHRERVAAMVLLCGMAENPLKTFRGTGKFAGALPAVQKVVSRAPRLFNRISRVLTHSSLAYTLATTFEVNGELLDRSDFMPYLRGLSMVEVPLFLRMLGGATQHDAVDLLPTIDVPVLVVGGELDGFTPPALSHEMADAIPDAELLIVEHGSHTAPIERPDVVNAAISEFLLRRVMAR